MKIFYKKDYLEVLGKKKELEGEIEKQKIEFEETIETIQNRSFDLLEENSRLKDLKLKTEVAKEEYKESLERIKLSLDETKAELKDAEKENKKLVKEKASLEAEIADLKAKIADLKSDRYLVRKISSGRPKKGQKMHLKSSSKESRAIKYVKENL